MKNKTKTFVYSGPSEKVRIKLMKGGENKEGKAAEKALPPRRSTKHAAGYDLSSNEVKVVKPGEQVSIGTGVCFQLLPWQVGHVKGRSGLRLKKKIDVFNGTLDADYTDELFVLLTNGGSEDFHINVGDRIAQMVIQRYEAPELELSDSLEDMGHAGFGSTGVAAKKD